MNNWKNRINIELESFFAVIFLVLLQWTFKIKGNVWFTGANSNLFIVFTGVMYYAIRRIMRYEITDLKRDFKVNSVVVILLTVYLVFMICEGIVFTTKQGEISSQAVIIAIFFEFYIVYLLEVYMLWKKRNRG